MQTATLRRRRRLQEPAIGLPEPPRRLESPPSPKNVKESCNNGDHQFISKIHHHDEAAVSPMFISSFKTAPRRCNNHKTIVDIDDDANTKDIAEDLYKNLRTDELKKRPRTDYMEKVQQHDIISPRNRARCIEHLAGMAEMLCLNPETLDLAVNYLDRCLSEKKIVGGQRNLIMVGASCMIIACKYEEVRESEFDLIQVFINLNDGCFSREDFIRTEGLILKCLKYELTCPTTRSFLERFVMAAYLGGKIRVPMESLKHMANYIADLSLLSYGMLRYLPSMIAASSVFLVLCILLPWERPWSATLQHYTLYQPSDLRDCVLDLHGFCYMISGSGHMPAIGYKYTEEKYDCVSFRTIPEIIPPVYFTNFI